MADVSQLEVNGTTYNICDATARDSLSQYLPLTGGTMQGTVTFSSGSVRLKSSIIDRDGTAPSAVQWSSDNNDNKIFSFYDKDGELISYWRVSRQTDQRIGWNLLAWNEKANGTTTYGGGISGFVDRTGTSSYSISDPTAFRQALTNGTENANTKFFRGDGELTNTLEGEPFKVKYNYFDLSQSNNGTSSNRWPAGLNIFDKDERAASFFGNTINSDGNVGASIYSYNVVNGTTKSNSFTVWVEKDGSLKYSYASPSAARDGLAMNTWTSVTATNWISLASGWSFDAFETYVNVALKKVVIRAHIKTTTARSGGNVSLGTIKADYKSKGRANIPPTSLDRGCTFYFDSGGAAYIGIPSPGIAANTTLYFAGEYSLV